MRLSRSVLLFLSVGALGACGDDVTDPPLPALADVRYINAVADTGALDIRMIDQVELSANAFSINYRAGWRYEPTEAKDRRFRVFPTSLNPAITSSILLDTTITIQADTRVTLLLTGSARARTLRFVTVTDDESAPASGQVGVRLVNASTGAVSGYVVPATTTAPSGTATFANVGAFSASSYIERPATSGAIHVTNPGSMTANASAAGPAAPATPAGAFPAAGINSAGSRLSAYYFPAGVAGSPQNAVTNPSIVWFVDRNPCDAGC